MLSRAPALALPSLRSASLLRATLLLAACGAPTPDAAAPETTERGTFRIAVTHDTGATFHRGANGFTVRAWDAQGRPCALTEASAWMPSHSHEHVSAVISAEGSSWRVDDLRLTMPGRWEITLRISQLSIQSQNCTRCD